MTIEYLEKEQKLIEEYIYRFCDRKTEEAQPITDGIVNAEMYLNSKYRICWVLKEPYDDEGGTGGDWSVTQGCLNQEDISETIKRIPTFQTMAYATYSILNGFVSYSDLDYIKDDPRIARSLREIALIDTNKMPSASRSKSVDPVISREYEYWKPILFWQLKQYDPQIIIFGNTMQHYVEDLGFQGFKDERINTDDQNVYYALKEGKIYIQAYHPAQKTISWDSYVQGIIDIVKSNIKYLES